MAVIVIGENLLRSATAQVTVTPSAANVARLSDGQRTARFWGAAAWDRSADAARRAQYGLLPLPTSMVNSCFTIDVDLGTSGETASGWGLAYPSASGSVTLKSGDASPAATLRNTITASACQDSLATFTGVAARYWRVESSGGGAVGELVLGAAVTVSVDPARDPGPVDAQEGLVVRVEQVGGYVRKIRHGPGRRRFRWTWNVLPDADWQNLLTAFGDFKDSAQPFLVQDIDGTARWVELLEPRLEARRVSKQGSTTYFRTVTLDLQEVR